MRNEDILAEALALGEEGDWEGMIRRLDEALGLSPQDPEVLAWLGVAEWELGNLGAAYDRFKEALSLELDDPFLLASAGNTLAHFDDPAAEGALRTATLLAPDFPLARCLYGAYLAREGLLDEALAELQAALELDPQDPEALYEMGVARALRGEWEEAAEHFAKAAVLDPEDEGWVRVVLGLVEVELRRMEEGAQDLLQGARLRPRDTEAQLLAALGAGAVGWEDLAWEMLERGRQEVEGVHVDLLESVEESLEEGAEAAGVVLVQEVLPRVLRERLMVRR